MCDQSPPPLATVALLVDASAESFLEWPELADGGRGGRRVGWGAVAAQLARRAGWAEEGRVRVDAVDVRELGTAAATRALAQADVYVALGVHDAAVCASAAALTAGVPTGFAFGCGEPLQSANRLHFSPAETLAVAAFGSAIADGAAIRASADARLFAAAGTLWARQTHGDLLYLILMLADAAVAQPAGRGRVASVGANSSVGPDEAACLLRNCAAQLAKCYGDAACRGALRCVDAAGLNDQTDMVRRRSLCIAGSIAISTLLLLPQTLTLFTSLTTVPLSLHVREPGL